MITCPPGPVAATYFLDGAVNIHSGKKNFVYCPKILVDTGVLIPSVIAISANFFAIIYVELSRLSLLQLKSANAQSE